ncbi:MAG: type II toxin-antitoxin system RelE/ParE family toxin [Rubrivivax sp.]|nr:type II toxin-antitoxin system RelE/ParE family toxin [Rubrivivax sp.]
MRGCARNRVSRSIHRLASDDLAEAVRFYRYEAGAGVAQRSLAEFERVAKLLEQHAGSGTPTADGRKVHPLTDFPYSIIYRRDVSGLRILVVRHQRRHPEYGEGRQ